MGGYFPGFWRKVRFNFKPMLQLYFMKIYTSLFLGTLSLQANIMRASVTGQLTFPSVGIQWLSDRNVTLLVRYKIQTKFYRCSECNVSILHFCASCVFSGDLAKSIREKTDIHFGLYHSLFEWFNPLYLGDKNSNFTTQRFVDVNTCFKSVKPRKLSVIIHVFAMF